MKKTIRMAALAVMAMAMLSGCGHDLTNRAGYDEMIAGAQNQNAKYTFDVPYKEFTLRHDLVCDTSYLVEALKDTYSNDIRFEHGQSAFVVDMHKMNPHIGSIFNGYASDITVDTTFTSAKGIQDIKVKHEFTFKFTNGKEYYHDICYGSALEVAKQIKTITDGQNHANN